MSSQIECPAWPRPKLPLVETMQVTGRQIVSGNDQIGVRRSNGLGKRGQRHQPPEGIGLAHSAQSWSIRCPDGQTASTVQPAEARAAPRRAVGNQREVVARRTDGFTAGPASLPHRALQTSRSDIKLDCSQPLEFVRCVLLEKDETKHSLD